MQYSVPCHQVYLFIRTNHGGDNVMDGRGGDSEEKLYFIVAVLNNVLESVSWLDRAAVLLCPCLVYWRCSGLRTWCVLIDKA